MFKVSAAWLFTILAGLPLFASMGLAALAFLWLGGMPITVLPQKMAGAMNSFPIVAAPLFILMGNLVTRAGLSSELYRVSYAFLGHRRGGLAMATIVACGGFSAICGSSIATAERASCGWAAASASVRSAVVNPVTASANVNVTVAVSPIFSAVSEIVMAEARTGRTVSIA